MYVKIFIIFILFFTLKIDIVNAVKLPTQEQLNMYGIVLYLKVDGDIHWFYYKHMKFDETGVHIVYGKYLDKINFIPISDVLNFEDAKIRWLELKELNL